MKFLVSQLALSVSLLSSSTVIGMSVSSSTTTKATSMTDRIHGFADSVHRTLKENFGNNGSGRATQAFDSDLFCTWVEAAVGLGDEFSDGQMKGTCDCVGDITTVIALTCNIEDICSLNDGTQQEICGDVTLSMTLSDVWDSESMMISDSSSMDIRSCVTVDNVNFLNEPWCITLSYYQPDFGVPKECDVEYGTDVCTCDIDTTGDICYEWDCSAAVSENKLLQNNFKSSACISDIEFPDLDVGSLTESSSTPSTSSISSFLPNMAKIPDEVETELTEDAEASTSTTADDSGSGAVSITSMNGLKFAGMTAATVMIVANVAAMFCL